MSSQAAVLCFPSAIYHVIRHLCLLTLGDHLQVLPSHSYCSVRRLPGCTTHDYLLNQEARGLYQLLLDRDLMSLRLPHVEAHSERLAACCIDITIQSDIS